ncbi:hypothetical protein [Pontiella sp.]|uniref:hypothetical protein n=1 Tax=Pontiella sp. TaxID=2837462 RepID=UPI003567600E
MGAKITVAGPSKGLYLVIGRAGMIERLVSSAGGSIAMRFAGGKILAALPFEGFMSLKANPDITRIGPVSLDMKRLENLTRGMTAPPGPPQS